jgi:hypothetical protein
VALEYRVEYRPRGATIYLGDKIIASVDNHDDPQRAVRKLLEFYEQYPAS